ncbi:MAG TPA: FAD binding domain-containing protein [Pyrinomonadaceae bacterium]|nr:FAD binding domain-containing protein [Pyrinomonadaceae bacterium]
MIKFILNNQTIETELPIGTTVLDFVRYYKNLKGTKIGCREGDCGACTILVGELKGDEVKYRTMTSCLMPIANANGKHIVTVEGINKPNNELTPVQQVMVDESGTQCGFCTVGFVMSLTNFCLDDSAKTEESAISAIDGNICRCTGYKSIERAASLLSGQCSLVSSQQNPLECSIKNETVPKYFADIKERLETLQTDQSQIPNSKSQIVAGGTDLYVQKHEEMVYAEATHVLFDDELRSISKTDDFVELGASVVVTDLLESEIFNRLFPNLYQHLKLVSSTPIRNMATLAGNFVNASPIGDMTAFFLGLNAEIFFNTGRVLLLKDFYLGYKQLAKSEDEFIRTIRFSKDFTHFNFEKVCKRTYLDIASVNSAISLKIADKKIEQAHVSCGGVFATPLYLRKTSEFLQSKEISNEIIGQANEILQTEISPISDVRGSAEYKRLLARQLFTAHFVELFGIG